VLQHPVAPRLTVPVAQQPGQQPAPSLGIVAGVADLLPHEQPGECEVAEHQRVRAEPFNRQLVADLFQQRQDPFVQAETAGVHHDRCGDPRVRHPSR
jgi:hypothetical protein